MREWTVAAALCVATGAQAEDAQVKTLADSLTLHAQLRAELLYEDHGLETREGESKQPTTRMEVQHAALKLDGKLNESTDFAMRANFLRPIDPLDYGFGTHWFNKMIGWSFGKMKVIQGGWDNQSLDSAHDVHVAGTYYGNVIFNEYETMTALHVRAAGMLTVQVLNDKVMGRDALASWNNSQHPTWIVSYKTEFGPISPMVSLGSYDDNKSRWVDAGISTTMNGLYATLDIFNRNHVVRYRDANNDNVGKANVATSITVYASYEIKGAGKPWFFFSTYDDKQAEDKDLNLEDRQYNTTKGPAGDFTYDTWDDNGQVVGGGFDLLALGERWVPYLAMISRSGKFEDPKRAGEPESKSETNVRFGAYASF